MVEVVFDMNQAITVIQANLDEPIQGVIDKFIQKTLIKPNSVYYIANAKPVDPQKTVESQMSELNKQNKKLSILVNSIEENEQDKEQVIVQSKDIICPECKEPCRYTIDNYQIKLTDCCKGHTINGIKILDFPKTQEINISEIICDICKYKNKGNSHNHEFFLCLTCKQNICLLCKPKHDSNHNVIKYDQKNYLCPKHNDNFIKYCENCHINICFSCDIEHSEHKTIALVDLRPDIEQSKKRLTEIESEIFILTNQINRIKNTFDELIKAMNMYYEINKNILENFEVKNRNYQVIKNINEINANNKIYENLKNINETNNIYDKIRDIIELYNNINNIKKKDNNKGINNNKEKIVNEKKDNNYSIIFGIEKNTNIKKLNNSTLHSGKEKNTNIKKLSNSANYNDKDKNIKIQKENNTLQTSNMNNSNIKKENNNITYNNKENINMKNENNINLYNDKVNVNVKKENKLYNEGVNNMTIIYNIKNENKIKIFHTDFIKNNKNNCYLIINGQKIELCEYIELNNNVKDTLEIKLIETNPIINMRFMFYNCSSLNLLGDISKWNTRNVTNMCSLFSGCTSLKFLPDISKWDTGNVTNMSSMFYGCSLLNSLPDISVWDTRNVTNMSSMFIRCTSLNSLPEISKWNTQKVTDMKSMFYGCSSLKNMPNIFKWNTRNVTDMSSMFNRCSSLSYLAYISEWDTRNVTNMSYMFYECTSLQLLPDISRWDTTNVTNMSYIFGNCFSLTSFPDISRWKRNKYLQKESMFIGVNKKIIPKKFLNCIIY